MTDSATHRKSLAAAAWAAYINRPVGETFTGNSRENGMKIVVVALVVVALALGGVWWYIAHKNANAAAAEPGGADDAETAGLPEGAKMTIGVLLVAG